MSEHTLPEERAAPRKPDHTEDSGALPEPGSTAAGRKFRDAPRRLRLKRVPPRQKGLPITALVSPAALGVVRFGLRAPDGPKIVDTVKVIDATLKVDTPSGPSWHRYNGDGYGEHADGSPFTPQR